MFAENDRISHRQLQRQIVVSLMAPFLLCLINWQEIRGAGGLLGIMLGTLVLYFYMIYMVRLAPAYANFQKTLGKLQSKFVALWYLAYVVLTGAYLLAVLEQLTAEHLMQGVQPHLAGAMALVVTTIGSHKGMQKRGRMAEVSYLALIGGIVVLFVLASFQGEPEYITESVKGTLTARSAMNSFYGILCGFAPLSLLPFLLSHVNKPNSANRAVFRGILLVSGLLGAALLLIQSCLGWDRMIREEYPIIPLMAGTNLPGDILARFDALWMAFLIYGLLFSLGSLIFYGNHILQKVQMSQGRWWLAAVIFLLTVFSMDGYEIIETYPWILSRVLTPGLLLAGFYVWICYRRRGDKACHRKHLQVFMCSLLVGLCLTGCGTVEPEKREYPFVIGVDYENGNYVMTYGMPDMAEATGQGKADGAGGSTLKTFRGRDYEEIKEAYNKSQEKYLDVGHVQALILSKELLRQEKWSPLLIRLKKEPALGENIYVFETNDVGELMEFNEKLPDSLGEYLTGLYENRPVKNRREGVILRQVYNHWYETGQLPDLPVIKIRNERLYL